MNLSEFTQRAYECVVAAWSAAFAPRPRLTVSEWADANRQLTSAETSEPGPWKTGRVPFIREIQDCLSSSSPVQRVVFMKSTQVAGTESGINWTGYVVDQAPSPMLVVEPSIEVAELWSKQRLANMITASAVLTAKIPPARSRDGGNTTLLKEYPGGVLRIGGANSAKSLRSMPVKNLFLDEVDAYPDDLDGEGDPVGLAEERTNNFPRRKILLVSTPTVKGASTIEKEFERSDMRYYHVPCPHCGHKQRLVHQRMKYVFSEGRQGDPDGLADVVYLCESCEQDIPEHHKTWMLENGEWVPTHPDREVRGYHINSYYSPIGLGRTWKERARQFLLAQKDPVELKRFINTALGETWEDKSSSLKANELQQRAKPYALRTVPAGVLLLTAGIDTQDDRLEMYVWGWGRANRCHIIDRIIIYGNPAAPSTPDQPNVWDKLKAYLDYQYRNQFGIDMRIEAAAIDSAGHHTQSVYRFCRAWSGRTILFATIGRASKALYSKPSKVDVSDAGGTVTGGLLLWTVGVDQAKSALYGALLADRQTFADGGELLVNFADELDEDFYNQLTAEVYDLVNKRWVKKKGQVRNEALDCWNLAYFAACAPPIRMLNATDADWQMRESRMQPVMQDLFAEASAPAPVVDPPPSLPRAPESPAPSGASAFEAPADRYLPDADEYWRD